MPVDLSAYQPRTPDGAAELTAVEAGIGRPLPKDLAGFLCTTGPGEGFIGDEYLVVFSAGELVQVNQESQVEQFAPGLFLVASNGGGEYFAYDLDLPDTPVLMVPSIGMERKSAIRVASTFTELLERLSAGDDLFS